MKYVILVIVSILYSSISAQTAYIKSIKTDKQSIVISYFDTIKTAFALEKDSFKRCFTFDSIHKVYLDVDKQAKSINSIDSMLKVNTIRPHYNCQYLPIMYFIFIIDKNGEIINKGFDRELELDEYQKEFYRLMRLINNKFEPSLVNGEKVASLLTIQIDYYKLLYN